MSGNLLHYASQPVKIKPREIEQYKAFKPSGLWVSVGSAWLDWCRGEAFEMNQAWYEHEVTLAADANILRLKTASDLDHFSREFGEPISPGLDIIHINWRRIAEKYDGILIAPYQRSRRLDLLWYYGWDCASGCIWNTEHVSLSEAVEVESGSY